jgi:hypothetical protein
MTAVEYQSSSAVDSQQIARGKILLRMAQFCAVAPMTAGISMVLLYWICDFEWCIFAGLAMLPIGLIVVVTGLALAIAWGINKRSIARKLQLKFRWRGMILLVLVMLANLAVAVACIALGIHLVTRPELVVQVINETGSSVDSIALQATFVHESRTSVPDRESVLRTFHPAWKSEVRVRVEQAGVVKQANLPITPDMKTRPRSIIVRVRPGGELTTEVTDTPEFD